MLFEVSMNKLITTSLNNADNVIYVRFSKSKNNLPNQKQEGIETMAEMFKRHKTLVPSELLFNDY